MMMDYENMFSIGQAITTTANSTNVIKIQKAGEFTWGGTTITSRLPIPYKDLGKGEPIQIHVQVVADFASGTSLQVQLLTADNADLDSNPVVLASTGAVPEAQLKAGYVFNLTHIPTGAEKEYIGLKYVADGTFDAGKVDAGIVADRQTS